MRRPIAAQTSLEDTVMSSALHNTAVPPRQDLGTSCLSFSLHFHWDGIVAIFLFFRWGTTVPKDQTASCETPTGGAES